MADNQNTVYLSTPSGHGNQSAASTALSDLSIAGGLQCSTLSARGAAKISAVSATAGQFSSTLSVAGATKAAAISATNVTLSSGLTIASSAPLSFLTRAADTGLTIGQLVLVQRASGLSLLYSSGASYYELCESTVSAAQA